MSRVWTGACVAALMVGLAGCSGDDATVGETDSTPPPAEPDDGTTTDVEPAEAEIPGVVEYFESSTQHVADPVDYAIRPPVGGAHFSAWQNCGFYDEPVVDELAVHSLEHGAVWLTYNESISDGAKQALVELASTQTHVLVSPYEHDAVLVMTAWNRQQVLTEIDDAAVVAFVEFYQQGPQSPEPGAPCDGAIGEPFN